MGPLGAMSAEVHRGGSTSPPVHVIASDEEVIVHVTGFAVLRAVYEAEGYYDEGADGDPAEEDLFRIEVLDTTRSILAAEAMEGEEIRQLADLGMPEPTVRRLFPASRWEADVNSSGLVIRYLLALAASLTEARGPAGRQRVLEASAGWSRAVIEDRFLALPPEWRSRVERGDC